MTDAVAIRKVFIRDNKQCVEIVISIFRPVLKSDEIATCLVKFSGLQRYDAELSGVDEINALECAISYVSKICRENAEPKFFWELADCLIDNDELS